MRSTGGWGDREPLHEVYASVAATGTVWWAIEFAAGGNQLSREFAEHAPLPEGPVFAEIAAAVRWLASDTDRH
ncbi:hypothetical protein [Nocardia jinanensis]|uniref:Uncharacterized protein n=1 Tax=Nocardia jinanensis TaxID=382504 RepID=A0A917VKA0_9NOCA|nr:hypothetical protein [Nocardia jinanensis]GGK89843.1 hypothetical protein GCM10011588_00120 [Nocardia jinanensis]